MGNVVCVPEDALDNASCWLERSDILSQRAVSRSARDAARRAIARKAIPDVRAIAFERQVFESESAHAMRAMGNVFGAGCTELRVNGTSTPIAALSSFVSATNGGLQKLELGRTDVPTDSVVTMCLASPNLLDFFGVIGQVISDEAIATIATACPKLEHVYFSELGSALSPAERWGRLFPRLRELDLQRWMGPDGPVYRPTRLDAIAEAARITSATELLVEGCHITPDVVEAVVGTPLGDRITKFGCTEDDSNETIIEDDAFFAAARGFPRLVHLAIPQGTTIADPDFYARLARIRTLESITISEKPGWHIGTPRRACRRSVHAQPLGEVNARNSAGLDTKRRRRHYFQPIRRDATRARHQILRSYQRRSLPRFHHSCHRHSPARQKPADANRAKLAAGLLPGPRGPARLG